jgi:hypothetical protein
MFAQYQTLIYKQTGDWCQVIHTPDQCEMHLGIPGKDVVPSYGIRVWERDENGGLKEGSRIMIAPKGLVEQHFRLPHMGEQPPGTEPLRVKMSEIGGRGHFGGKLTIIEEDGRTSWTNLRSQAIGPETQATIAALHSEPARGTGAASLHPDDAEGGGVIVHNGEMGFAIEPIRKTEPA